MRSLTSLYILSFSLSFCLLFLDISLLLLSSASINRSLHLFFCLFYFYLRPPRFLHCSSFHSSPILHLFFFSLSIFSSVSVFIALLLESCAPLSSSPPTFIFTPLRPPPSFSLCPRLPVLPPSLFTLLPSSSSLPSSPALAASSGQLPISSLEGAAGHMLLGGPGGAVPPSLRPSLFLNRPTLLPMVTGSMATASTPAIGLVSGGGGCGPRPPFSQSPPPGTSDLMSPTSCPEESASPCSSPASFCSFSEASPPPLGGAMAEWPLTDSQSILSEEDEEEEEEEAER